MILLPSFCLWGPFQRVTGLVCPGAARPAQWRNPGTGKCKGGGGGLGVESGAERRGLASSALILQTGKQVQAEVKCCAGRADQCLGQRRAPTSACLVSPKGQQQWARLRDTVLDLAVRRVNPVRDAEPRSLSCGTVHTWGFPETPRYLSPQ